MSYITDIKQRILDTIRALGRPGTEAVIDYLNRSTFFRRGCYGHHKEFGGLAQHSIEVYDHMPARADGGPVAGPPLTLGPQHPVQVIKPRIGVSG